MINSTIRRLTNFATDQTGLLMGTEEVPCFFLACHLKEGLLLEKKNMQIKVSGEQKFTAKKEQFAVAPTTSGYQVAYSANRVDFTLDNDAVVPAGENLVYLGAMTYGWYMLSGNTDDNVNIIL